MLDDWNRANCSRKAYTVLPDDGMVGICAEQCYDSEAESRATSSKYTVGVWIDTLLRFAEWVDDQVPEANSRVYDAAARARRAIEPAKRADAGAATVIRSEFERDQARVLHSYAFPPARGQDSGRRARRRRLPSNPTHALARGGADRSGDGRGARL